VGLKSADGCVAEAAQVKGSRLFLHTRKLPGRARAASGLYETGAVSERCWVGARQVDPECPWPQLDLLAPGEPLRLLLAGVWGLGTHLDLVQGSPNCAGTGFPFSRTKHKHNTSSLDSAPTILTRASGVNLNYSVLENFGSNGPFIFFGRNMDLSNLHRAFDRLLSA
jgi:hypothetical protein